MSGIATLSVHAPVLAQPVLQPRPLGKAISPLGESYKMVGLNVAEHDNRPVRLFDQRRDKAEFLRRKQVEAIDEHLTCAQPRHFVCHMGGIGQGKRWIEQIMLLQKFAIAYIERADVAQLAKQRRSGTAVVRLIHLIDASRRRLNGAFKTLQVDLVADHFVEHSEDLLIESCPRYRPFKRP
ncbi:hypothetical protein SD51_00100 [Alicyclobacillus tengchongensis]|nr:hypothetical protein SD51_00100 [Alicyclobacillus tengchongensis]